MSDRIHEWETREVGTVSKDQLLTVRESVKAHVDAFIRDYFAVNALES